MSHIKQLNNHTEQPSNHLEQLSEDARDYAYSYPPPATAMPLAAVASWHWGRRRRILGGNNDGRRHRADRDHRSEHDQGRGTENSHLSVAAEISYDHGLVFKLQAAPADADPTTIPEDVPLMAGSCEGLSSEPALQRDRGGSMHGPVKNMPKTETNKKPKKPEQHMIRGRKGSAAYLNRLNEDEVPKGLNVQRWRSQRFAMDTDGIEYAFGKLYTLPLSGHKRAGRAYAVSAAGASAQSESAPATAGHATPAPSDCDSMEQQEQTDSGGERHAASLLPGEARTPMEVIGDAGSACECETNPVSSTKGETKGITGREGKA